MGKINNIISFICCFLLVFDLKIINGVGSANVTTIICFLYLIFGGEKFFKNLLNLLNFFKIFILSFLILWIYILIRIIFSGVDEYSYLLTMLKTSSILFATILYLSVFSQRDNILFLFIAFFANALICLFFGSFPELKSIVYMFQHSDRDITLIGLNEYRNAFLAGSGYFGISALYSLAFILFLFNLKYIELKYKTLYFSMLFFICLAGLLAGRVALISYLIIILLYTVFEKKVSILMLFGLFGLLFFLLVNNFDQFESFNSWFLELYGNNAHESSTISDLKRMFYFPNETTFLFGDAKYTNDQGGYYGHTDVGFMRNILFGGIFYVFLLLVCLLSLLGKLKNKFLFVSFLIVSIFLHFKGVFILNNPGFFPIVLIGIYSSIINGDRK